VSFHSGPNEVMIQPRIWGGEMPPRCLVLSGRRLSCSRPVSPSYELCSEKYTLVIHASKELGGVWPSRAMHKAWDAGSTSSLQTSRCPGDYGRNGFRVGRLKGCACYDGSLSAQQSSGTN
jgi:hypothetical protein